MSHTKKCHFKAEWLENSDFKCWVYAVPGDNSKAGCKICQKVFDISNMGVCALKSHAKGSGHSKHQSVVNSGSIVDFLCKPSSSSKEWTSVAVQPQLITREDTLKAEIVWVLKCVESGYSFSSCSDISAVFSKMFPDSATVRQFSCGKTKCAYLVTFGIARSVKEELLAELSSASEFVISFDESLNKVTQSSQMDLNVRFWSDSKNKVTTRYLDSKFMSDTTADSLLKHFLEAVHGLDLKKLLQVSMDGPSVNWKFLRLLSEELAEDKDAPSLLQLGSCGLHSVHGAFRNGMKETGVSTALEQLWKLFKNVPARRNTFIEITKCLMFPLKFCPHRWVENCSIAERAQKIWPSIQKYVQVLETEKKMKCKVPKTYSFDVIRKACHDNLTEARLSFFVSVAKQIQPFLKKYQSNGSLSPLLCDDLYNLTVALLSRFVKQEVLSRCQSAASLSKLNVSNIENHVVLHKIDTGFAAQGIIQELQQKDLIGPNEVSAFQNSCKKSLIKIVEKLFERSPMKYSLTRLLSSLQPARLALSPDSCLHSFQNLLLELMSKKRLTSNMCDLAMQELRVFLHDDVSPHKDEFSEVSSSLDQFYATYLSSKVQYFNLWRVVKMLLILSHGQADVERGFSIQQQHLLDNMREQCIVAERLCYDYVQEMGGVANISITDTLMKHAKSARMRYQEAMEQRRNKTRNEEKSAKRKTISDEKCSAEHKFKRLKIDIAVLEAEAFQLAEQAEKQQNLTLLAKSNALHRSVKEKKDQMTVLEGNISKLVEQLKTC